MAYTQHKFEQDDFVLQMFPLSPANAFKLLKNVYNKLDLVDNMVKVLTNVIQHCLEENIGRLKNVHSKMTRLLDNNLIDYKDHWDLECYKRVGNLEYSNKFTFLLNQLSTNCNSIIETLYTNHKQLKNTNLFESPFWTNKHVDELGEVAKLPSNQISKSNPNMNDNFIVKKFEHVLSHILLMNKHSEDLDIVEMFNEITMTCVMFISLTNTIQSFTNPTDIDITPQKFKQVMDTMYGKKGQDSTRQALMSALAHFTKQIFTPMDCNISSNIFYCISQYSNEPSFIELFNSVSKDIFDDLFEFSVKVEYYFSHLIYNLSVTVYNSTNYRFLEYQIVQYKLFKVLLNTLLAIMIVYNLNHY